MDNTDDVQPLQDSVIDLVLRYLIPPSNLALFPVPAHLFSEQLNQRHHFLEIPVDPPVDYLCWQPCPDAIEILEQQNITDEPLRASQVCYLHDGEFLLAHAQFGKVRLLFQWQPKHSDWRYHDLSLMPFPSAALSSPAEAISAMKAKLEVDYWDSYTGGDEPRQDQVAYSEEETSQSPDDHYWRQYNAVDDIVPHPVAPMASSSDALIQRKQDERETSMDRELKASLRGLFALYRTAYQPKDLESVKTMLRQISLEVVDQLS